MAWFSPLVIHATSLTIQDTASTSSIALSPVRSRSPVWKVLPSAGSMTSSGSKVLKRLLVTSPMPLYTDSTTISAMVLTMSPTSEIHEMTLTTDRWRRAKR